MKNIHALSQSTEVAMSSWKAIKLIQHDFTSGNSWQLLTKLFLYSVCLVMFGKIIYSTSIPKDKVRVTGFEASWILSPDGNDISSKLPHFRLSWPFQGCWMWPCNYIGLSALGETHWVPWACVCPVAPQPDPPPPRLNLPCSRLSHSSQGPGIAQCSILNSRDQSKKKGIESLKSLLCSLPSDLLPHLAERTAQEKTPIHSEAAKAEQARGKWRLNREFKEILRQVISETKQCKIAQLDAFIIQRHSNKTMNFKIFQNFLTLFWFIKSFPVLIYAVWGEKWK